MSPRLRLGFSSSDPLGSELESFSFSVVLRSELRLRALLWSCRVLVVAVVGGRLAVCPY